MNRSERIALVEKHLSHLDAKVLSMYEGREEDVVFCIKSGGFSVHNVRAHSEFLTEVFGSYYFGRDQQAEAEAKYFEKTQQLTAANR